MVHLIRAGIDELDPKGVNCETMSTEHSKFLENLSYRRFQIPESCYMLSYADGNGSKCPIRFGEEVAVYADGTAKILCW